MNTINLIEAGYKISTMKITSAELISRDPWGAIFLAVLEGAGGGVVLGGNVFGRGSLRAKAFSKSIKTAWCIIRLQLLVDAENVSDLNGKYVLVAHKGLGSSVKAIGNILGTEWIDPEPFIIES